ncbi:MAG: hypothetical protein IJH39_01240 [Clostridia bacterium]|nr:hypothetical protein [Clostridia bacterium]
MNNIEILENCWLMKTNHVLDEENKKVRQSIENLIKENKELKEDIENWKFTKKYVEENYIARAEIIKLLNKEIINISGFECIAKSDIEKLLED